MGTVTQAHVWQTGESMTATNLNANPAAFVAGFANIDNTNIGAAGIFASQISPTSSAQASFGSTQVYTFPRGLIAAGTPTSSAGVSTGLYGGTGSPNGVVSAANGSLFLRYDGGSSAQVYINTTGASSSGTSWTAIPLSSQNVQQSFALFQFYTTTGSETNGSPGAMATATLTLGTSPLTNWRVSVTLDAAYDENILPGSTPFGIGSAAAGTNASPLYASAALGTHTITGGNCVSDIFSSAASSSSYSNRINVTYEATYTNNAALSFTALIGANSVASKKVGGSIKILAVAN